MNSRPSLDGRCFRSVANVAHGDVSTHTSFVFAQSDNLVSGTYGGGAVRRGTLIALMDAAGDLDMRYQHATVDGILKTGECRSTLVTLADGRLAYDEDWQWTSGSRERGRSRIEEVHRPNITGGAFQALFALSPDVRYVAVASGQDVETCQRAGVLDASSSESDRYEELLVNPALLTLTTQRGAIDCGGLEYLVVRYGHFFQIVMAHGKGHASMCVAADSDPIAIAAAARVITRDAP